MKTSSWSISEVSLAKPQPGTVSQPVWATLLMGWSGRARSFMELWCESRAVIAGGSRSHVRLAGIK